MTTTLRQALRAKFTGDAAFMTLASGGVHDGDSLGRRELTLDDLTAGTPVVKPALLIRWTTETSMISIIGARELAVELYFYQHSGYDTIRQMRERAYALLDRNNVVFDTPSSDWLYEWRWAGDVLEQQDDTLGGASMERSRFMGYLTRLR